MQPGSNGTPPGRHVAWIARTPRLVRLACATVAAFALCAQPSSAEEPPVASFSYEPPAPLTLDTVEFRSTSVGEITSTTWDLDNDGACDDAEGPTASRAFPVPTTYRVRICVAGPSGEATQARNVAVANRPPHASFEQTAAAPHSGQEVTFVATATDPDGTITSYAWDLDADAEFDDAVGVTASRAYLDPGAYPVSLRVTDDSGAEAIATRAATIAPSIMSPTPRVRLAGRINPRSVSVRLLTVQAPGGALIDVRCHGGGCTLSHETRLTPATVGGIPPNIRFGRFERRLRARAVVEIRVTQRGAIGTYTAFKVRAGRPPRRTELCLAPGSDAPIPCPKA